MALSRAQVMRALAAVSLGGRAEILLQNEFTPRLVGEHETVVEATARGEVARAHLSALGPLSPRASEGREFLYSATYEPARVARFQMFVRKHTLILEDGAGI